MCLSLSYFQIGKGNISVSRCAKLKLETYPKIFTAVLAVKGGYTIVLRQWGRESMFATLFTFLYVK